MHIIHLLLLVPCLSLSVTKPKCFECKHFIPDGSLFDSTTYGKCAMFTDVGFVSETKYPKYASTCRANENMCGENGNLYIKEENMIRKYAIVKIFSLDALMYLILFFEIALILWIQLHQPPHI